MRSKTYEKAAAGRNFPPRTPHNCPLCIISKSDVCTIELPLDEAVPVEVVRGLEGEERCHTHDHGPQDFIADVEVVVSEAVLLAGQDAVIGILGRELRGGDPEARPLLHALENEAHAESVLLQHFPQPGLNIVFLAHALLGPFDGDLVIAGKGLDPVLIVGGALAQDLLADDGNTYDAAKEMHNLFRP